MKVMVLGLIAVCLTIWALAGLRSCASDVLERPAEQRTVHALGETKDSGPSCIETYSNLESAVYDKLSSGNTGVLETQKCATQRKVLDYLVKFPPDRRDEVLGALFDAAPRR